MEMYKAVIHLVFIHCLLLLPLFVLFFCVGSLFCGVIFGDLSSLAIKMLRKR